MAVANRSRVRIEIFGMGASRGPGTLKAIIDDAKNVGVSAQANAPGEAFFTLPWNHPAVGECEPLQRHYRASRWNGTDYDVVGVGVLDDFTADKNEVVIYGSDYMSLLNTTISSSNTSYTNATLGSIVTAQLSAAINETNSRLGFTVMGTIDSTSQTATLLTSFQSRLDFIRQVAEVSMADRSVRTILTMTRSAPFTWAFTENAGTDRPDLRVEFGGAINNFDYRPNFRGFASRVYGIGVKREGATILYSTQTGASESTYGWIARPELVTNVVNQTAFDRIISRRARLAGRVDKNVIVELRSGDVLRPVKFWDIPDSIPIVINRGSRIAIAGNYTVWGWRWVVPPDASELLYLDLATKEV